MHESFEFKHIKGPEGVKCVFHALGLGFIGQKTMQNANSIMI